MDLEYAAEHGIAVFNSPFSNSRSVAELVIGEIIALARQLGDRSNELHRGTWNKVSSKCWEIRGKTLGRFAALIVYSNCLRYCWVWPYRLSTFGLSASDGYGCSILRRCQLNGYGHG